MARLAKSLVTLRDEINRAAPRRSKASDGWIGDPAHAARPSRHNPNDADVVCALDITHDPAGGMDVHALARRLVESPHPDLEYVISNDQIASRGNGWRWVRYGGSNPHIKHAHFAVGRGPDSEPRPPYDTTTAWGVIPVVSTIHQAVKALMEDDDVDPAVLACILYRLYLGRDPESLAMIAYRANQITQAGAVQVFSDIVNSAEGQAFEAAELKRRAWIDAQMKKAG